MTLVKRTNSYPVWSNFMNDFLGNDWSDWSNRNFSVTNTTLPSVNVKENDNEFTIEMAAPGMEKKDFKIEVFNNILTVSSEKQIKEEVKEGECYTRREFSYQSFKRSFNLPETVNTDKIEAGYENGILLLTIPKREEAKPKALRQIEIS